MPHDPLPSKTAKIDPVRPLRVVRFAWTCLALACLTTLAGGCGQSNPAPSPPASVPAPSQGTVESLVTLTILDYEGVQKLIERHRGKVVVMDVWSTTCPPCIKEFPELVKLHRKHPSRDVACISLSLDYLGAKNRPVESYQEPVLKFLRSRNATFDNVLASEEVDHMLEHLELSAPPAVYVYNRQGELVRRFDNESEEDEAFSYEQVDQLVAELLTN